MKIQLRKRLGDLLVEEGIVSEDQIQQALSAQRSTGQKLGDALIDLGFITEKQMLEFLSQQLGLPLIDLGRAPVDADAVQILPEVHARRLRAMVVARNGDTLRVAMSDPADLFTQESLMNLLGEYNLEFIIASERQLISSFDRYYRRTKEIASFAEQLQAQHQAVVALDKLYHDIVEFQSAPIPQLSKWQKLMGKKVEMPQPPKGLYFWGGVGRGKLSSTLDWPSFYKV
ncbi:msha biogenesis protein mshe [Vibrio parahaemolyticus AQ3810]|nr:msha biogenesis protein mshe [Vibrio parahaemolyticus AQ3810]